ncbi:hypothetical protein SAMN05660748_3031 [Blastococcus aggregatus]|uniref:DUF4352 domain-containing protein n=1 Tax=Blastococcus aggregatus TaxID=38502 RepID=A0A285V831_9ACTN|nr:DUF4190 domain-containing protein [Blastococcus aggregatus]SOC50285.1 hypothetical protein SAMN05660748_3031 [Blastococcus aggregatus]
MSHPHQPAQDQQHGYEPQFGQPAAQQYYGQGQPPYGPPPGPDYQYGGQQPPGARKGSGLAISALVLAIIAVLLCWVPIVNNFAAVLAVVGLALGIPALVSARRGKRSGSGMAMASVILSVLAFAGVLATQAFYGSVIDDVADEIRDSASGLPSSADAAQDAEADEAAVLSLGQSGQLSEYTVTVDSVTANGNEIVADANQFNDPPTGQYVLVDMTVTYNGTDDGDPWLDLTTEFVGSDARKYDASSCYASISNEVSDVPTLLAGGTASFQVCMDVPPTAIDGGQVQVSESFSFDDVSATWAIQ